MLQGTDSCNSFGEVTIGEKSYTLIDFLLSHSGFHFGEKCSKDKFSISCESTLTMKDRMRANVRTAEIER